jgi:predicted ATPase
MVGRQREFSTLTGIIADAKAGRGAIVSIIGEAGLGKSRLVAEWRKAALQNWAIVRVVGLKGDACLSALRSRII